MSSNRLFALALSACAVAASPIALAETETGLEPAISQQQFNDVMYCIGRNEGAMEMTRRVAPHTKDPKAFMGIVEANQPLEERLKVMMQQAAHPSNRLDLSAGEAQRKRGQAFFGDHADNGSRAEYEFLVSNKSLTDDCANKLSIALSLLDYHAQTLEKLAALPD